MCLAYDLFSNGARDIMLYAQVYLQLVRLLAREVVDRHLLTTKARLYLRSIRA